MDRSGQAALDVLAAKVDELGQVCARLGRENAELRGQVRRLAAGQAGPGPRRGSPAAAGGAGAGGDGAADARITRRRVGKALGAVAAGAVGAAAFAEMGAQPAAASDLDPVTAGFVTTAERRTSVLYDGPKGFGGVVLLGNDSTYDGGNVVFPAAAGGFAGAGASAGAGGVANGVLGMTDNGDGYGVVGFNTNNVAGSGAGVFGSADGANSVGVNGFNGQGTAVSGTSHSEAANATAIVGTITAPGSFSAGVRGVSQGIAGLGIGVWGSHAGSGWGVYGTSVSGIGVNADGGSGTGVNATGGTGVQAAGSVTGVIATGSSVAVSATGPTAVRAVSNSPAGTAVSAAGGSIGALIQAANTGSGPGIQGNSATGRGGVFTGAAAQIQLAAATKSTHPASGVRGDLYVDNTGRLWFCKTSGTHATWVKIV
jgi:hypothetical protein